MRTEGFCVTNGAREQGSFFSASLRKTPDHRNPHSRGFLPDSLFQSSSVWLRFLTPLVVKNCYLKTPFRGFLRDKWCTQQGSNLRPQPSEGCALIQLSYGCKKRRDDIYELSKFKSIPISLRESSKSLHSRKYCLTFSYAQ